MEYFIRIMIGYIYLLFSIDVVTLMVGLRLKIQDNSIQKGKKRFWLLGTLASDQQTK